MNLALDYENVLLNELDFRIEAAMLRKRMKILRTVIFCMFQRFLMNIQQKKS